MPIFEMSVTINARVASNSKEKALEDLFIHLLGKDQPNVFSCDIHATGRKDGLSSDEILALGRKENAEV